MGTHIWLCWNLHAVSGSGSSSSSQYCPPISASFCPFWIQASRYVFYFTLFWAEIIHLGSACFFQVNQSTHLRVSVLTLLCYPMISTVLFAYCIYHLTACIMACIIQLLSNCLFLYLSLFTFVVVLTHSLIILLLCEIKISFLFLSIALCCFSLFPYWLSWTLSLSTNWDHRKHTLVEDSGV